MEIKKRNLTWTLLILTLMSFSFSVLIGSPDLALGITLPLLVGWFSTLLAFEKEGAEVLFTLGRKKQ